MILKVNQWSTSGMCLRLPKSLEEQSWHLFHCWSVSHRTRLPGASSNNATVPYMTNVLEINLLLLRILPLPRNYFKTFCSAFQPQISQKCLFTAALHKYLSLFPYGASTHRTCFSCGFFRCFRGKYKDRHEALSHSLKRTKSCSPLLLPQGLVSKTKPPFLNQTEENISYPDLGKAHTDTSRNLSTNFRNNWSKSLPNHELYPKWSLFCYCFLLFSNMSWN